VTRNCTAKPSIFAGELADKIGAAVRALGRAGFEASAEISKVTGVGVQQPKQEGRHVRHAARHEIGRTEQSDDCIRRRRPPDAHSPGLGVANLRRPHANRAALGIRPSEQPGQPRSAPERSLG